MICFHHYFSAGRSAEPYASAREHIDDCLTYLSMLLDVFNPNQQETDPQELLRAEAYISAREEVSKKEGLFLPLLYLEDRLSLTLTDRFLVLLAFAPSIDFQYGYLYAGIQGDASLIHPTLGLAAALLALRGPVDSEALYRAADEAYPMTRLCFTPDQDHPSALLVYSSLVLNKKTVMFLLQISYLSPNLAKACCLTDMYSAEKRRAPARTAGLSMEEPPQDCCHPAQLEQLHRLLTAPSCGQPLLIQLTGAPGCGRKYLLSLLARRHGLTLLSLDMRGYDSMDQQEALRFCDDIATELALTDSLLYLDRASLPDPGRSARLSQLLSRVMSQAVTCGRPVFISTEEKEALDSFPGFFTLSLSFPLPDTASRKRLWKSLVSSYQLGPGLDLEAFASQYLLTPGKIFQTFHEADAWREAEGAEAVSRDHLVRAIKDAQTLSFGVLASRVRLLYTWQDLELPPQQKAVLRLACDRKRLGPLVRETWGFDKKTAYGNGMSLLFSGPPGTGKTMAAQVMARELGMDLYRVDLSQISSKYIGETEKNLNAVFQEAKKADIILFFDEADSLFTKRTDVSTSNDKFANSQTSYILQKLEEYEGVSILATNLSQNFDPAFLRRITYSVRFEMPDADARLRLWNSMLPKEAPVSGLTDFRFLADHFELTGSSIKSILHNAAYLAAGESSAIQAGHIVHAIKYEFAKIGRMISDDEFGQYQIYL